MKTVVLLVALLTTASAASAQSTAGIVLGVAYAHPDFQDSHLSTGHSLGGWLGAIDVPMNGRVGIVARADGTYGELFRQGVVTRPLGATVRSDIYTFTGGARVSTTPAIVTFFGDGLIGVAHGKARSALIDFLAAVDDTKFVGGGGGGVVVRVARTIDLIGDVQYRRTRLFDQTLNLVQVGAGVALRLTRQ